MKQEDILNFDDHYVDAFRYAITSLRRKKTWNERFIMWIESIMKKLRYFLAELFFRLAWWVQPS